MLSVWVKTQTWVANAMKAYRAVGTFRNGRTNQNYSLDVVAADEEDPNNLSYQTSAGVMENSGASSIMNHYLKLRQPIQKKPGVFPTFGIPTDS